MVSYEKNSWLISQPDTFRALCPVSNFKEKEKKKSTKELLMLISVRFWRFGGNNLTQRDSILLLVSQHYNGSRAGLSCLSLCIITFTWDRASLTPIYHITLLCHFMLLPVPCLAIFKNSFTVRSQSHGSWDLSSLLLSVFQCLEEGLAWVTFM